MTIVLIILVATNLASLAAIAYLLLRPVDEVAGPDAGASAALDRSPAPASAIGTRRLISVEILNPIELAGTRGRLAGVVGSLAPGLTRRIVYDQTLKIVREQLQAHHVVADVRIHTLRPVTPTRDEKRREAEPTPPITYTDEVHRIDLEADSADNADSAVPPNGSGQAPV